MLQENQSFLRTVIKGSTIVSTFTAASQLVALVTTLYILREIPVFDYGLWRLLLSVISAVGLITLPSLDSLIIADMGREVGKGDIAAFRGMLHSVNWTFALMTVLGMVVMWIGAPILSALTHFNVTKLLWILSFALPGLVLDRVYGYAFATHLYFKRALMMDTVSRLFYFAIIVWYGYMYGFNIYTIVIAYTASSFIAGIIFLPVYLHAISYARSVPAKPYSMWSMLRGHGKWALASGVSDTLSNSLKPWVTGFFIGVEVLGIFSAATSLLSAMSSLVPITQVLSYVLPRESHNKERLIFWYDRTMKYSIWLYLLIAIAAAIVAPRLIPIFLPKYVASIPMFLIMLISFVGLPIGNLSSNLLTVYRSQKQQFLSNLVVRVVTVFLELPLALFFFGVSGAVIDQIFTTYFYNVMRVLVIRRVLPEFDIKIRSWFTFDQIDKQFLSQTYAYARRSLHI